MGEKINTLETSMTKLWRDGSPAALELEKEIKDKGYDLIVILSGSPGPVLSGRGYFLVGYNQIKIFIDR